MKLNDEKTDSMPLSLRVMNIDFYATHTHSTSLELIYCLKGSIKLTSAHVDITLSENELLLVDRDDPHCLYSSEDNSVIILHIDLRHTDHDYEQLKYLYFTCATASCRPEQKNSLERITDILLTLAYVKYSGTGYTLSRYIEAYNTLCDILVRDFSWFTGNRLSEKESIRYRTRLEGIFRYLQEHYPEKLTAHKVAEHFDVNIGFLSQFLKKTSFGNFSSLLQYIRCYEAEKLLLSTDLPVHEISERCGFSSVKYFHKYFRMMWNNTPLQHRKRHRLFLEYSNSYSEYDSDEAFRMIEKHIASRAVHSLLT